MLVHTYWLNCWIPVLGGCGGEDSGPVVVADPANAGTHMLVRLLITYVGWVWW